MIVRKMLSGLNNEEVWRECVRWLVDCNILRKDHKISSGNATIVEFANLLRDGVLLCNLLHIVDPDSIDFRNVNQRPQMAQFLCLKNIQTFINACRKHYNIRDEDIFEPSMLFDLSDFHNVLYTLSKLSNCSKFIKRNVRGFSINKFASHSQEEIYRDLQMANLPNRTKIYQEIDDEQSDYNVYYSDIINEKVYHDLCSIKPSKNSNLNQNDSNLEKRDYVIKELIDTEANYVNVLLKVQKSFMRPLNDFMSNDDFNIIFFGIKDLIEIHIEFLNAIRKACSLEYREKLSNVFLNWQERFLIYGPYCANLPNSQNLLQELCDNNEKITTELIKCQNDASNGKFKLRDILSVPMQRILKYHLLLDKLISDTEPNDEDYEGLKSAKQAMDDVALYINEVKRDSDHLELLKQMRHNIIDWNFNDHFDLSNYGRLLIDCQIKIKAHEDQKIRSRYIFIFNKVIILCKIIKSSQYSFRNVLNLEEYLLEDNDNKLITKDSRWSHQWHLVRKTQQNVFTMYARTLEVKRKLIAILRNALDDLEPYDLRNTDHEFELLTFTKPRACCICSKFLKGLICQGYLCKLCHFIVHKDCITDSGRCNGFQKTNSKKHLDISIRAQLPLLSDDHLWFVGEMDRDTAAVKLEHRSEGTFLVRIRPLVLTKSDETPYALSLKTKGTVKHMKIFKEKIDNLNQYFLSKSRYFKTIPDLVNHYENISLSESFEGFNETLKWPYRQIYANVINDFNSSDAKFLSLKRGCRILIVNKNTSQYGIWKGKLNEIIGYFPSYCVDEEKEIIDEILVNN